METRLSENPLTDWNTEALTQVLGVHYADWKFAEKEKNRYKDEFFKRCTEQAAEDPDALEEILVTSLAWTEEEAIKRAEQYHPRFKVDDLRLTDPGDDIGTWDVIMIERPQYKAASFINTTDRLVYQRQVVAGSATLDDERLLAENAQLHEEVTFELPWGARIVRPLDSLAPEYLSLLSDYIHEGKPTVKFPAPRPATDEELGSVAP